jgi:hypothetical protein
MRFHTPLDQTKLLNTSPAKGAYGLDGSTIIASGDPEHSILLTRMKTRGQGKMPPLATSIEDDKGVDVIKKWIKSLK